MSKKIYKNEEDSEIFGVCAGLSDYTDVDVSIIRIITFILGITTPFVFWIYVIAAIVLPTKD